MVDVSLRDMLQDPVLTGSRILAGDPRRPGPDSVDIVESLEDLGSLPNGSLAILGRQCSRDCLGYRLDVALREVAEQGITGLMLTGPSVPEHAPAPTEALARKADIVVLGAPADQSLADLVLAMHAAALGGAEQALRRAEAVLLGLRQAEVASEPGDTDALRIAASEALGSSVELRNSEPGETSSEVFVDGQVVSAVSAATGSGHMATAVKLSVALTAAAMERSLEASIRTQEAPVRSRDAVLSELLVAGDSHAPALTARARHLGLPIDGWHRALMLQVDVAGDPSGFGFQETLGRLALRFAGSGAHQWHLATSSEAVLLLQMWRRNPPSGANRGGLDVARQVVEAANAQFSQVALRCGVGTIHEGVSGLRATVAEARAALAGQPHRQVAAFDQAGLQSMLLEWYATDTARRAVKDLLEPLDGLGGERARTAIATLQTYLDEQGSLARTADRLHLHRNAVSYRMKRIATLLEADLDDPEQRLALQLACRARLFR